MRLDLVSTGAAAALLVVNVIGCSQAVVPIQPSTSSSGSSSGATSGSGTQGSSSGSSVATASTTTGGASSASSSSGATTGCTACTSSQTCVGGVCMAGAAVVTGVNLSSYCTTRYGSGAEPNPGASAYGWTCVANGTSYPVDLLDACRFVFNNDDVWADFSDVTSSSSWSCYLPPAAWDPYSLAGGMNLTDACTSQHPGSTLLQVSGASEALGGWACQIGSTTYPIDYQANCQRQYSSPSALARFISDYDSQTGQCFTPTASSLSAVVAGDVNLSGYCQHYFGPTAAAATSLNGTADGWQCQLGAAAFDIHFDDACRWSLDDRSAFAQYSDFNSTQSWQCFVAMP